MDAPLLMQEVDGIRVGDEFLWRDSRWKIRGFTVAKLVTRALAQREDGVVPEERRFPLRVVRTNLVKPTTYAEERLALLKKEFDWALSQERPSWAYLDALGTELGYWEGCVQAQKEPPTRPWFFKLM
jgi:hypothetical protein